MANLRGLAIVFPLIAVVGCGSGATEEGLKLINAADLVALLDSPGGTTTVLDANGADFRAKEGIIAGATLLSNYKRYDVEKELPSNKDARLVFYCADTH